MLRRQTNSRDGSTRPAAVAGTFYPDRPDELQRMVDDALADARARRDASGAEGHPVPLKALIAPHAGYLYSGPVAASGYVLLEGRTPPVERVVLIGPTHRVPLAGLAVPSVERFATPLGPVTIDPLARALADRHPTVAIDDRAHAAEHSLEVHLPFLQRVLGDGFTLVPLVVGEARPAQVADVLDSCWGGPETLVVASTDLSHYHDHRTAQALDRATATTITDRRPADLRPDHACGARAVAGLLEAARRHDLGVELLDLRTSGDTAGPHDRVVGYGAFALA